MRRASFLVLKISLLFVGLITAGGGVAAANAAASGAAKRPNNSFNLYVAPPHGATNVQLPTQGMGVASGKTVIMDPYKVPLIQNAGSLTPGR